MSAAPQNASYQSLYRSCMKEAASRGHTLMQRLATRCGKSMAQRATGIHDPQERSLLASPHGTLFMFSDAAGKRIP